jgi:PadR family transcriptional regulator, regulatory protein PadR
MDTTQLLKGVLDVAVLAAISTEDGYGYEVVRRLRAAGLDDVGEASVYGTLRRLFAAGALTSYVVPSDGGPHRKYYGMNTTGRQMLDEHRDDWTAFARTMDTLLSRNDAAPLRTIGGKKR